MLSSSLTWNENFIPDAIVKSAAWLCPPCCFYGCCDYCLRVPGDWIVDRGKIQSEEEMKTPTPSRSLLMTSEHSWMFDWPRFLTPVRGIMEQDVGADRKCEKPRLGAVIAASEFLVSTLKT